MYFSESPDFELFKKQHRGTQKRNKNNKRNTLPKYAILSPRTQNTNFRIPPEWVRVIWDIFIRKEFRGVRRGWQHYSADFRPIGRNFDPDIVVTHKSKIQKMRFFSIFSKFVLDDSRYQIRLPNHSRTPKMSFSGHISISRTISATLRKINFLIWKNTKSPHVWILSFFTIWSHILQNVAQNLKYVLKFVLQVPKILLNTYDASVWHLDDIFSNIKKSRFLTIFTKMAKYM